MSNQASLGDISEKTGNEKEAYEQTAKVGPIRIDIPESWGSEKLESLFKFETGQEYDDEKVCRDNGVPLFTMDSIKEHGGSKRDREKYFEGSLKSRPTAERGNLLIANRDLTQEGAIIGAPIRVDEKSTFSNNLYNLGQDEKLNSYFASYMLQSSKFRRAMRSISSGTTVLALKLNLAKKLDFPIPEKDEQRRIASVLYNVDQAISKTEEIIEQTQRVKKGLMQDLLVGEGYSEEKKRIQIGPEEFEIPEEWEKKELEELIDIQSGDYFKKKNFVEDGVRCLKIDNVGYGRIFWDSETRLPESYLEEHEDLVLEEGDLLMAMNRPITQNEVKVGLVEEKDTPSILYQRVGRFHTDEKTDNRFLKFALRGFIFKKELKRRLSGTNQPYVNNGDIYSIEIPFPPLETQEEIAEKLGHLDRKIELHREEKEQLQRLKKGLMQDLLTGSVRTGEDVEVLDEVVEVEG